MFLTCDVDEEEGKDSYKLDMYIPIVDQLGKDENGSSTTRYAKVFHIVF